jgi:hypothetical protein
MIKTAQKTIDGSLVSVTELPFTRAQKLGIRLIHDLGPIGSNFLFNLDGAQEKIAETITELTTSLSHENLIEISRELFYNAALKGPKSNDSIPFMKNEHEDNFDAILMQEDVSKPTFYKALIFAFEVNYKDFIVGPALKKALDVIKKQVAKNLAKSESPAPKSSPAGEPGGSS